MASHEGIIIIRLKKKQGAKTALEPNLINIDLGWSSVSQSQSKDAHDNMLVNLGLPLISIHFD